MIKAKKEPLLAAPGAIFRIFEALLEFHSRITTKIMTPMGKKRSLVYSYKELSIAGLSDSD
jgi:hypothetical protein